MNWRNTRPSAFSFVGCDRLQAIEAVFALQFKRT